MLERLSFFNEHFIYLDDTDWSKPSSGLPKSEYALALASSIFLPVHEAGREPAIVP
jgi:hypothetical protein